jgi:26S proteasome regulatory subunit T5
MSETAGVLEQVAHLTNEEIRNRIKMFEGNMKQYKLETGKITHDAKKVDEALKDNRTKIKQNKQLPWLVSNVVEILDI